MCPTGSTSTRINSTACSKVAAGFIGGREVATGGFSAKVAAPVFAVLTLSAQDGEPVAASSSLLLTALSRAENSGLGWNEKRDSVGNQWGTGPVLALAVTADITLQTGARQATVYALDNTGARLQPIPSTLADRRLSFHIGPEHKAVWYEIAAQHED